MPKHYLIKRSPDFTRNRVLVKRANKRKGYSETTISSQKRMPASYVLREGDTIYVAEKAGFIYAKGTVNELFDVIELTTVTEVFNYIKQTRRKDELYWYDKLKLVAKQEKDSDAVLRLQGVCCSLCKPLPRIHRDRPRSAGPWLRCWRWFFAGGGIVARRRAHHFEAGGIAGRER